MWPGGESARALAARGQPLRIVAKGRGWLKKHSLVAKAVPTSIGFAFGDFLTQYMHWKGRQTKQPFKYEWQRGAKMGVVGAVLAGPLGLGLLRWMDGNIMTSNPNGLPAMTVKFTLDQVVGCLMWQVAYCAIHPPYRMAAETLLSTLGTHLEAQTADVRRKLLTPLSPSRVEHVPGTAQGPPLGASIYAWLPQTDRQQAAEPGCHASAANGLGMCRAYPPTPDIPHSTLCACSPPVCSWPATAHCTSAHPLQSLPPGLHKPSQVHQAHSVGAAAVLPCTCTQPVYILT